VEDPAEQADPERLVAHPLHRLEVDGEAESGDASHLRAEFCRGYGIDEVDAFSDSYQSVQRFVRKLKVAQPQRVWRMEARPGEELQLNLDFGLRAPIWEGCGRRRRSWVLRMVLSYSRKAYSEAVLRQDTETFLCCLENGLSSFGVCPLLLNLDNTKSA
jgi:transposase